jgi:hypothetical protein
MLLTPEEITQVVKLQDADKIESEVLTRKVMTRIRKLLVNQEVETRSLARACEAIVKLDPKEKNDIRK